MNTYYGPSPLLSNSSLHTLANSFPSRSIVLSRRTQCNCRVLIYHNRGFLSGTRTRRVSWLRTGMYKQKSGPSLHTVCEYYWGTAHLYCTYCRVPNPCCNIHPPPQTSAALPPCRPPQVSLPDLSLGHYLMILKYSTMNTMTMMNFYTHK